MSADRHVGRTVIDRDDEIVVIGAGPAGLTAAHQLAEAGVPCVVVEADSVVGGISRTVIADGFRFDIGGHRFFTKVEAVEALWQRILPDGDLLTRRRVSRIFYDGKFYDYPIRPINALANLGVREALPCVGSFLWARVRPPKDGGSLEAYVVANYGRRLYEHFFRTYTEKVWGVPADQLSADWGAQRIKGMSLWRAVWEPLRARLAGRRDRVDQVTSLIDRFQYPRLGPGMMWERCRELVEAQGSKVILDAAVTRIVRGRRGAVAVDTVDSNGAISAYAVDHVISSMPLADLARCVDPPPPEEVLAAADELRFRDFLCVALVVPAAEVGWSDNWIYVHDPGVKVMRVQNFGNWSPDLVRDGYGVLGLEYTVQEGDEWWERPDDELVAMATDELDRLGLVVGDLVETGYVVRMPKAYPVYDERYQDNVDVVRRWLASEVGNVHPVGRNGMHRYNNQDHSMYTAMLTVENLLTGSDHDIWQVNVEGDYHEEGAASGSTGRDAPVVPRSRSC